MGFNSPLSPLVLLLICAALRPSCGDESDEQDAREGENITLQCRFPPNKFSKYNKETLTYYWIRNTPLGQDNVAIGKLPLERTYQVSYGVNDGRYDLLMSNVTYEKDNGRFECRVKAAGSSETLHSQGHEVVVLSPPRSPTIKPGSHVHTQEDREMNFTCITTGGSPQPEIKWYREGSSHALESIVKHGRTRSEPSNATLTLIPKPEDDGATFRCVVWNRAMPSGEQLDAKVDLEVDYFPRVDVGPINPLRVATGATAVLNCQVKAKPSVNTVNWLRNGKFVSDWPTYTIQSVTVQEGGTYTCSADNGLGRTGEKDIHLDVLFPPTVTLDSTTYEAEEGGNVEVNCQVSSNPEPSSVQWTKEGQSDFQIAGKTLLLKNINADMAGTYTCKAINVMSTSDGKHVERASTASVAVLVRHKPGRAYITPEQPKILEKSPATLTCNAKPPGWPAPQYRWYYSTDTINETDNETFATGKTLTIAETLVSNEGVYSCQAFNELGNGERSTVTLRVIQPPRFLLKLQNHVTKIAGEEDFSVSCGAQGKPRPIIKWFKNRVEIEPDNDLYEIVSDITETSNSVYNAQTTLKFHGKARPKSNDLIPDDRGLYMCMFQNEVTKVDSVMHLRIEHKPILVEPERKVAYDLMEMAKLSCRVIAYPKPELQWFFGLNGDSLQMSNDDRYEISTTDDVNDTYLSVLKIKGVKHRDYGDYYCKVANTLGVINPKLRLQPKGAPDTPQTLASPKAGSNYVTLKWEAGFNGGLSSTKYFVRYHRVLFGRQAGSVGEQCADMGINSDWMEYDCGRMNPCNVTHLDQDNTYSFKVKAINTKGQSNYSNELTVTTKVDNITAPERVVYDPNAKTIMFSVAPTCLSLVAVAEGLSAPGWQVVDTITLHLSGSAATSQEAELDIPKKSGRMSGRHLSDPSLDELNPRIRLKLCLKVNLDICSDPVEAEIGQNTRDASALAPAVVIAIVVSCLVFFLFLTLLFIFCHCKLNDKNKNQKPDKDYEMDAMRAPMESALSPPPPYYQTAGMDNKALEHSMDLAMAIDDSKNTVYAGTGYGYHGMPLAPHVQAHGGQNMSNTEWVNLAYMENSYTNSNNGGSVNSRDSLWQLKMANNPGNMPAHPIIDRQSNYAYDPITPAGYDTIEDYAPYPHLPHGGPPPAAADYNLRGSQNPSRQDYCSDPYASVHKPKKRMDQHIESPYHEVSGLPEAYGGGAPGEDAGPEDKPHMSINYDDSLESGYSTPNSRARRVIREIIV